MKISRVLSILCATAFVAGCATRQDIARIEGPRPTMICIAEHTGVRGEGVLPAIQDGIAKEKLQSRVIPGTYEQKDSIWHPRFNPTDAVGCDALLFYVANWNWDMAWYMYFATIWMTDADGQKSIARATYDASTNMGFGKFINAREKILELVDQMLSDKPSGAAR